MHLCFSPQHSLHIYNSLVLKNTSLTTTTTVFHGNIDPSQVPSSSQSGQEVSHMSVKNETSELPLVSTICLLSSSTFYRNFSFPSPTQEVRPTTQCLTRPRCSLDAKLIAKALKSKNLYHPPIQINQCLHRFLCPTDMLNTFVHSKYITVSLVGAGITAEL